MLNANQRDGRYVPNRRIERKEVCTGGAVQTSGALNVNASKKQLYNNINLKACQGGPADD